MHFKQFRFVPMFDVEIQPTKDPVTRQYGDDIMPMWFYPCGPVFMVIVNTILEYAAPVLRRFSAQAPAKGNFVAHLQQAVIKIPVDSQM